MFKFKKKEDIPNSFPEPSLNDLVREQLKGITVNFSGEESSIEDGLDENEKMELYADAHALKSNKAFQRIVKYLIDVQGNYTVREAITLGDVAFGRATINGISLMKEETERLSNLYIENNIREEEFNPYDVV